MQDQEDPVIYIDVYLDNISLDAIGVDALGVECYSKGAQFSDSGKVMRVFFDDESWAREFALIVEMSGKKTVPAKKVKK